MLRDSRIVHIIDLLGELRELLLVIDQAGDTAPAILLKLAKEKAEEITRLTRELRQPEFWDGILRYDPFTSVKTTTHEDAIPSMENPLEKVGEPVSSHITDENIIPTEKQSEESGEELDTDNNIADTEEYSASPIIENNEPTHENDTEENEEENDTLYPWEKLNGEELSAVQDENDDEYEDSNEFDEDMEDDYEEPDLYEEENTEEIISSTPEILKEDDTNTITSTPTYEADIKPITNISDLPKIIAADEIIETVEEQQSIKEDHLTEKASKVAEDTSEERPATIAEAAIKAVREEKTISETIEGRTSKSQSMTASESPLAVPEGLLQ